VVGVSGWVSRYVAMCDTMGAKSVPPPPTSLKFVVMEDMSQTGWMEVGMAAITYCGPVKAMCTIGQLTAPGYMLKTSPKIKLGLVLGPLPLSFQRGMNI
jgi:hypothetical protein